jgi:hypothetical protein
VILLILGRQPSISMIGSPTIKLPLSDDLEMNKVQLSIGRMGNIQQWLKDLILRTSW